MKVRSLLLICLFSLFAFTRLCAQNLYPERIELCSNEKFCMDCGTPKATCDSFTLAGISDKINYRYNLKNGFGTIAFQVYVSPAGNSCVLSHTDGSHSGLSTDLIIFLNTCLWKPAIEDGKPVAASVNVVFTINYGKISGRMQRMDLSELKAPDSAIVYNKQYQYSNPSLKNYTFAAWNRYNSPLPDNAGQACLVDNNDILWYATAHGLTRFDGKGFSPVNETNSPFTATTGVHTLALDKDNNKWMYANKAVYMNSDAGWQVFDSVQLGIPKPYRIVANSTGEIMFPNDKGLLIFRNGKKRLIDDKVVWQLPSNKVYYAYYDSRDRLWIGTARGTIMLDKKQNVTVYTDTRTPLHNVSITNVTEDEKGNLYFSLSALKKGTGDDDDEGIAVLSADGKWSHYNDKNSGLPANHVNAILYDKVEHVLWVGTKGAGLARFDLKDGWENYHNNNSAVPGPDIFSLAEDSKGTIYGATANGLLRITKKVESGTVQ